MGNTPFVASKDMLVQSRDSLVAEISAAIPYYTAQDNELRDKIDKLEEEIQTAQLKQQAAIMKSRHIQRCLGTIIPTLERVDVTLPPVLEPESQATLSAEKAEEHQDISKGSTNDGEEPEMMGEVHDVDGASDGDNEIEAVSETRSADNESRNSDMDANDTAIAVLNEHEEADEHAEVTAHEEDELDESAYESMSDGGSSSGHSIEDSQPIPVDSK